MFSSLAVYVQPNMNKTDGNEILNNFSFKAIYTNRVRYFLKQF